MGRGGGLFLEDHVMRFGKHDMERLGLFCEMPYMNGMGYVSPFPKPSREKDKGRQIMGPYGRKTKTGTQHGYFDEEFRRIYTGEAIQKKKKVKIGVEKKTKNLSGPYIPPGGHKVHSTPGDFYSTFGGIVEAFSAKTRPVKINKKLLAMTKPPVMTNPGKKGNAGYANICLSKYPEHITDRPKKPKKVKKGAFITTMYYRVPCGALFGPDPYKDVPMGGKKKGKGIYIRPPKPEVPMIGDGRWIPVGPAKWPAGCHAGTFDRYPAWKASRDPKKDKAEKAKQKEEAAKAEIGNFYPQSLALKSMLTTSILKHNTNLCVNATNVKTYEPNFVKYLLEAC